MKTENSVASTTHQFALLSESQLSQLHIAMHETPVFDSTAKQQIQNTLKQPKTALRQATWTERR